MANKKFRLRIYHDHFSEDSVAELPKARRVIYCVAGQVNVTTPERTQVLTDDQAFFCNDACKLQGEHEGARLWRWELVEPGETWGEIQATAVKSVNAGDYLLGIDTLVNHFMRLDRVSFPLGGEALTHTHAAAGVRCLLKGNMLLESAGKRYRVWPGDSWIEYGPDPVYAKASERKPTAFVRVMIIPEEYQGRSTITYVHSQDKDKPKSQSYKRYLEEPITL